MAATLAEFLRSTPGTDGIYQLSPPRPFQHDEEEYDQQRPPEQRALDFIRQEGATLLDFFHRHGHPEGAPILEVGCGSGFMSLSLATQSSAGHILATDPSPAFCRITQRKLAHSEIRAARVDVGLLRAEDVNLLPAGAVSLIFLRSVLHHILDVDEFIARCAAVLPPGGMLICEEPYYEGYVMMGFLGQFIADALHAAGESITAQDQHHIDNFIATMQYYSRRDVDKSEAEDKHLFRPDELLVSGRQVGLDLVHYPNWHIAIPAERNLASRAGYFENFFGFYIRKCMNWPPPLADRVVAATRKYFQFFAPLESPTNTAPYCFGTFVFTKRR